MLHLLTQAAVMCFNALVIAQPDDYRVAERAYVVLQKQNLGENKCEACGGAVQ